jgi:hypothetical protein
MVKWVRNGLGRSGVVCVAQVRTGTRDQRLAVGCSLAGRSGRQSYSRKDNGRANKRDGKAEEGGLRIMKGSRSLVEASDG